MWMCWSLLVIAMPIVFILALHMDPFRSLFFTSPAWITCFITGPCLARKDWKVETKYRLLAFSSFMFLGYWSIIHCYPCQCRHAWGTMMVADTNFWGNKVAEEKAVTHELDSYYNMAPVRNRTWWDPPLITEHHNKLTPQGGKQNVSNIFDVLNVTEAPEFERLKKWIAPLTGGLSVNNLKLRAYCNIHRADPSKPFVYPFKTIGISSQQIDWMLPCHHWTCLLTEARPDGKLIFIQVIAIFMLANYLHYRIDCHSLFCFQCAFGTGQWRAWWTWFWAALLPLLGVMALKTTQDTELGPFVWQQLAHMWGKIENFPDWAQKNVVIVLGATGLAVALYVYRDKVRRELGLDYHSLRYLFPRAQADMETIFQVCVWRIDITAEEGQMKPSVQNGYAPDKTHAFLSSPALPPQQPWNWDWLQRAGGYLSMIGSASDRNSLRKTGSKLDTLQVCFNFQGGDVQRTRVVRLRDSEWYGDPYAYFNENLKLSIERRPGETLVVEVRDAGYCLGSVAFTYDELSREFLQSEEAEKRLLAEHGMAMVVRDPHSRSDIALRQVTMMMQGGVTRSADEMAHAGFRCHRLSDGGAIWLALCKEADDEVRGCACCQ